MPPPASPASSRSISINEYPLREETTDPLSIANINKYDVHGNTNAMASSVRPPSAASNGSTAADEAIHDQLQSRILALEYDNERLRTLTSVTGSAPDYKVNLPTIERERDDAVARAATIEAKLVASEHIIETQRKQITSMGEEHQQFIMQLETDHRCSLEALQIKLDDNASVLETSKGSIIEQEAIIQASEAKHHSMEAEITRLERELQNSAVELQTEKNELGAQIDELRVAGQVIPHVV
jgi:chromosome segregation ATPase